MALWVSTPSDSRLFVNCEITESNMHITKLHIIELHTIEWDGIGAVRKPNIELEMGKKLDAMNSCERKMIPNGGRFRT